MPPATSGRKGNAGTGGGGHQRKGKAAQAAKGEVAPVAQDPDEDTNAGFGKYLRSEEGIEMMKLFVIANTIVVFVTMAWPQMQQSYRILRSLVFNDEDEDSGEL
ncbi:uncharacterized protein LOC118517438 isoform X2 [Anopheles stephensi]|uniref:Uncharacterized protein n=1 Tax=Anopheles stephensi TaxID=30069 RepID=A0A182YEW5_ANOST|nr:uncharacterized protein LOC118517438 isoform X2 [Anopheles stephensi]XP_035919459.1 uncharacterized protein LOC118517438 isoform X2 [Anopheles stephensi]XP_035919460.1 uncharacterized protein LOC118517438 isoform X2 [Anopheles stephensi]XP_035919461.1 uncharacterized protein LOC118517438 isoform X2 [Anopheles stephensi]